MPALSGEAQFGKTPGEEPFVCSYQKAIDLNPLSPTTEQRRTKREHVIDEIISTELSYVKDLSQIIEVCVSVSLCECLSVRVLCVLCITATNIWYHIVCGGIMVIVANKDHLV